MERERDYLQLKRVLNISTREVKFEDVSVGWRGFWCSERGEKDTSPGKKGVSNDKIWEINSLFIFQILSVSCIAPHTMLVVGLKNVSWWFQGLGCICASPDCFVQIIRPWTGVWEEVISFYRHCGALRH